MNKVLPPEEYYKNLPRKYIGSGGLFLNDKGEVLIVKPKYKDQWEIPGGVAETNESPQEAFMREIKEELGLDIKPNQLLVYDFSSKVGFKGDAIMMVFFGGILTPDQIAKIKLPADELTEFRFVAANDAIALVTEKLAKRLPKALVAYKDSQCIGLKDGEEP